LNTDAVEKLPKKYGSRLLIENSKAFFAKSVLNTDTFYSARKFFGVPDGAYLYSDTRKIDVITQDVSNNRMAHLLKRIDLSVEDGFSDFQENEKLLKEHTIMAMSELTQRLLCSIDYNYIMEKRRTN
jgi:hypothetical protein